MSIYCTGWRLKLEISPPETLVVKPGMEFRPYFAEIYEQFVLGHIGHPAEGYETDPYADFLPPVVSDPNELRAVVIVMKGYEEKDGQRYVDPVLVLSGEEYKAARFGELLERIRQRIEEILDCDEVLERHRWTGRRPD